MRVTSSDSTMILQNERTVMGTLIKGALWRKKGLRYGPTRTSLDDRTDRSFDWLPYAVLPPTLLLAGAFALLLGHLAR
jgi:hypothetical protein